VGLILLMVTANVGPEGTVENQVAEEGDRVINQFILRYYALGWPELPGILINIIFAAVFIGVEVPPMQVIWEGSGPQIMYSRTFHNRDDPKLRLNYYYSKSQTQTQNCHGMTEYVYRSRCNSVL
jgi:hypothetical protein